MRCITGSLSHLAILLSEPVLHMLHFELRRSFYSGGSISFICSAACMKDEFALLWSLVHISICSYYRDSGTIMDETMKLFQQGLVEVEVEAEKLLLARHELVEIDRVRNRNREALTALRKRARTTKTRVPSPFESIMRDLESRSPLKEVCATWGDHDAREKTLLMFPGTDMFATVPFHAAHSILEEDQARLDYDSKKIQSFVKEKSLWISEKGALSDKISPGMPGSLVTLTDQPKLKRKADTFQFF